MTDQPTYNPTPPGPNLPHLSAPVPVPANAMEDAITPLGSELCLGPLAETAAQAPLAFALHAQWMASDDGCCEGRLQLPPAGSAKLTHWTLVPATHARAVAIAGSGADQRAAAGAVGSVGGVRLRRGDWGWDGLLPVGGVTAVLAVMTDAVASSSSSSKDVCIELLALVAELLKQHPFHREAFLQTYGFHVVAALLKQLHDHSNEGELDTATVDACLSLVNACGGAEHGEQLWWAGVQGLLLDWGLWGCAPFAVQV